MYQRSKTLKQNQLHLPIKQGDCAPYVLLPGDPARVDRIVSFLDDSRIIGQNREFRVGKGTYKGIPISVVSTGIGCPSTAIAIEECIQIGAKVLIRVGTCGGAWRSDIPAGSLIIPTACVRDEGTTREYVPEGFPAVADFFIVQALLNAARTGDQRAFPGINRTHDAFYGNLESITKWGAYLRDARWENEDTPILSSDMETSALFVVASLRGVKAGAVLAVNANPEPLKARLAGKEQRVVTESNPRITEQTVDAAIRVALEAIVTVHHSQPFPEGTG